MKINVTQEIIDESKSLLGKKWRIFSCPLALATRKTLNLMEHEVSVGIDMIDILGT